MSEVKEHDLNQNLASIAFLGLTLLFVALFLSQRGDDIGRLPNYLSGLFNGNLFSAGTFGESLLGLLIAILIAASWFGLGKLFTVFFEEKAGFNALNFARDCAFGAAIWSLIWFFIGLLGGYNKAIAIVTLVIGAILAIYFAFGEPRILKTDKSSSGGFLGKISFGFLLFTLFLTLVSSLAPVTAKDALLYHIALPKAFVAQGSNAVIEGNITSFLALGVEMQNVWAMLLGNSFSLRVGESAVGAVVFMFAPLLLLAIYGWAREFELEKKWSLLVALMVAAIPTFYHVASSVYVDVALALFITLAVHSIGKWWTTLQSKWLIYTAIALGAALSIKLTTIFVIAALTLIILLRARNAQSEEEKASENSNAASIFAKGFAAFIVAGLIASPWYLRTWMITGSPIFPFYMNLWKGVATGWDIERSALFQVMNSNYGGASKDVFDYLLAPLKISLWAQPELPEFYDGVLGVSFLLGLILIVWAWRRSALPVELKIAVGVSVIVFLFWLFSSEQLRYLLPITPSLAIASIVSANLISAKNRTFQKAIYIVFLATSAIGILTSVAWFAEKSPVRVVFGGETRGEYLMRRLDYYVYYKTINNDLPLDAKVWLINMRRDSYHIDRDYFSDYLFEDWTLQKMVEESKDLNDLRNKAKQMGITHLLVRHDFLLDYSKSVVVDEKRPENENRAKLKMTQDFVLDKANTLRADNKFSLVKLP